MVAIDLDDTLLNDNFQITNENREAIKQVMDLGVFVCIVSGRSYSSIKKYIKNLNIVHLCGSLNGAMVTHPGNEECVFSQTIDQAVSNELVKEIELLGIHVNYYHDQKVVCKEKNEKALAYMEMTNIEIDDVGSLEVYSQNNLAGKLLLIDKKEKLDPLKIRFSERYKDQLNITYSKPDFLEIYNKKASKGEAVKAICQYYGFKPEETVAIGDGENDISMIEFAGLGVSMGNSSENVKSRADYVTLSNNENGVAHVLKKFILNP